MVSSQIKAFLKIVCGISLMLAIFSSICILTYGTENATKPLSGHMYSSEDGMNYINNNQKALYWHKIEGNWYYFGADGKMVVGWQYIEPRVRVGLYSDDYIKEIFIQPKWYYFNKDGRLISQGWQKLPVKHETIINKKYGESVAELGLPTKWYFFNNQGEAMSNWINEGGKWYYLSDEERSYGEMVTGWHWDKKYKSWFFLEHNGMCAENQWEGSYYLKKGGYMAKSEWIYDQKYKSWFYLKEDGTYAENQWVGPYYVGAGGYWIKDRK